jgi:iron complex transport system substrate-binding protein
MSNTKKTILISLLISIILICLSVIINAEITINDQLNRKVVIPDEVNRIVAVGSGSLRIISYMEAADLIVGVEDIEKRKPGRPYLYAHPEFKELPLIGPQHGGEAELIIATKPDLILRTFATGEQANTLQQKTGIPVVVTVIGSPGTMDLADFKTALRLTGIILKREERAEELINYIDESIDDLKNRTKDVTAVEKKKIYIGGVAQRGAHGIISTDPAYPPFAFLNVNNVASDIGLGHVMISKEKLLEWDPEVIFIDEFGLEIIENDLANPVYSSLTALKEGNIYGLLPYNFYSTNFGTLLANSYYIGKIIYPDRFEDINPVDKANEIYTKFLGKPVYEELAKKYGGFKRLKEWK